jgi:hypothetical protein
MVGTVRDRLEPDGTKWFRHQSQLLILHGNLNP